MPCEKCVTLKWSCLQHHDGCCENGVGSPALCAGSKAALPSHADRRHRQWRQCVRPLIQCQRSLSISEGSWPLCCEIQRPFFLLSLQPFTVSSLRRPLSLALSNITLSAAFSFPAQGFYVHRISRKARIAHWVCSNLIFNWWKLNLNTLTEKCSSLQAFDLVLTLPLPPKPSSCCRSLALMHPLTSHQTPPLQPHSPAADTLG